MDRLSQTPSFDESPSHDSAIGTPHSKPGSSRIPSGTAPSASSPLAAAPTPPNIGQLQAPGSPARPRRSPFDYAAAARQHALNTRHHANNDTWPANQVPLPLSRAGNVPSIIAGGHAPSRTNITTPRSPTSPSQQRAENNVSGEFIERALGLPRGRRTPSLRNAPELQWDLSRPLPRMFSLDESASVVPEDDIPVGRREGERTRLSPMAKHPSPDEECPLLPPAPTKEPDLARVPQGTTTDVLLSPFPCQQNDTVTQHHDDRVNFSRPTPARYSRAPSSPGSPDAVSEHQLHRPSPLYASPHLHPQRCPGETHWQPADTPQSPNRASSRATYSAEAQDPSLSTAQLLNVRRVTNEDVRRGEITIARLTSNGDAELEPLSPRETVSREPEVEYLRFLRELREKAARHKTDRHTCRRKMRRIWGKVRDFFDF